MLFLSAVPSQIRSVETARGEWHGGKTYNGGVALSFASAATDVRLELLETAGMLTSSANAAGCSTGLVYTAEVLASHAREVELYSRPATRETYGSNEGAAAMAVKARNKAPICAASLTRLVTETSPWGNVARS